ncbi:hypothetical protein DACRYDRAFT_22864 [Dacryopinax primogenitus]|uniref:Uncharacterized protein n=1 Tax=Dacryopinax primogenitus (strain DJM 731) TaxID=1858805 RepID=M5G5H6_DACPD|nr:uncharacterized protein DACRYDRAFT_22864 [Dacryopinax primogenitus]EJU01067.1 hypothetical protein DACRYDRAFT_22864 [Dacryopinax primogenitus]
MFTDLTLFVLVLGLMGQKNLAAAVTTLGDGTAYESGKVEGMTWQASGILTQGCTDSVSKIDDCYEMTLSSNPNDNLDPGNWTARQRNELHFPPQADGSTWNYQWKHYLASGVGSTTHFFHMMQVFSTMDDGPLVTLDPISGAVRITDYERGCNPCGPTYSPLSSWEGRTTMHEMTLTSGSNGNLQYAVSDASTGAALISYSVSGYMGGQTYVKFGTYRATEDITTGVTAYVGDFASSQQ